TVNTAPLQVHQEKRQVVVELDGPAEMQLEAEYTHPDLYIDFSEPLPDAQIPEALPDLVEQLRFAQQRQRLHFTLAQKSRFLLSRPDSGRLQIILVPRDVEDQVKETPPSPKGSEKNRPIEKIRFSQTPDGETVVAVHSSKALKPEVQESSSSQVKILLPHYSVPGHLAKLYRLDKFESPVRSALLREVEQGALLTCALKQPVPFRIQNDNGQTRVVFESAPVEQDRASPDSEPIEQDQAIPDLEPSAQKALSGNFTETEGDEPLFPGMQGEYTGETISIDLQDADLEHVLRLLASMADKNLIIGEGVQGSISLQLDEVPWDQALDLVLLQNDLGKAERGNILRIAPAETLAEERQRIRESKQQALEAQQKMQELEPLQTEFIQINYTTAGALKPQLQEFLSERGRIGQDSRTNTLIVSDTQSNIRKVRSVIERLDQPEPQVLIEARVVYATDSFQRGLGISFDGEYQDGDDGQYNRGAFADILGNYEADTPVSSNVTGILQKATGVDLFTLDAQLKLGERKNLAKTISAPRLVTLNNQQAEITQGVKIATPGESESGGTITDYTEAVLSLSVKPQITPDDKVILALDISDDSPAQGGQDIDTRTAKTTLLVEDQETVVLGGVYQLTNTTTEDSVPGLNKLPFFRWLFRGENINNTNRELLIFIRPTVLE
ncbi:MAG: type IV pilus secretin PilQ, partial [Desulfohalobium sp.]